MGRSARSRSPSCRSIRSSRTCIGTGDRSPRPPSRTTALSKGARPYTRLAMPGVVIVGAQWGDEGKGKVVDLLAEQADLVIRFSGGNNAGHTIVNEKGEFHLHLVPSGIF